MIELNTEVDTKEVTFQSLLETGAHFGHKTADWNPKMAPYIYGSRNGTHIIDINITLERWQKVKQFIIDTVSKGGTILFVGTKKQATNSIVKEARRCGAFYVNFRWPPGVLTNFSTIRKPVERLRKLKLIIEQHNSGEVKEYTKKELLGMSKQVEKLEKELGGIVEMRKLPSIVFISDLDKENIAVQEAKKVNIPIIALGDTNVDPTGIDYLIPANDDAVASLNLFISSVANAVLEGKHIYNETRIIIEKEIAPTDQEEPPSVILEQVELPKSDPNIEVSYKKS